MGWAAGQRQPVDHLGARRAQRLGTGAHRGAGRQHVVHEQDPAWRRRALPAERAAHIFGAGARVQARLLFGHANARQAIGDQREAQRVGDLAGQRLGLIKSTLGQPVAVQRHRHHGINHERPRREVRGHQPAKRLRQAAYAPVFELMHNLAHRAAEEKSDPHVV